ELKRQAVARDADTTPYHVQPTGFPIPTSTFGFYCHGNLSCMGLDGATLGDESLRHSPFRGLPFLILSLSVVSEPCSLRASASPTVPDSLRSSCSDVPSHSSAFGSSWVMSKSKMSSTGVVVISVKSSFPNWAQSFSLASNGDSASKR